MFLPTATRIGGQLYFQLYIITIMIILKRPCYIKVLLYQAIKGTNVDLNSKVFCGIHVRAISQELLKTAILDMSASCDTSVTQRNSHAR